nr:ATP-dependent RecD-like DNA helicase [Maliibacterium massiliense]
MISRIVYRNEDNGFSVLEIDPGAGDETTAVGNLAFVEAGERVRLWGEWVSHNEYGQQLKVTEYETVLPTDMVGMERYLGSGMVKGIGPSTAQRIVQHFGMEAMDIMLYAPQRLTEISGIGPVKCAQIAESFREQHQMRDVMVFLQGHGVSPLYAVKIYKRYGEQARDMVQENPYRLTEDIEGIGFLSADRIGRSLGIAPDASQRLEAGLTYMLQRAQEFGHVCLPQEELVQKSAQLLEADIAAVERALSQMLITRRLVLQQLEAGPFIYRPVMLEAEQDAAFRLARLARAGRGAGAQDVAARIARKEEARGITLADGQRMAIQRALTAPLAVITGGPGTGKTTVLDFLLDVLQEEGLEVLLCAPTGRAAKRMSDATGREACTIHRLLEYASGEGAQARFNRNEEYPLEADVVVVDECSMVDLWLMSRLLRALAAGTRLILVGDANQLPPVGPGNVLEDIIASGAAESTELTEIFRQAQQSLIVVNAHRIHHGEQPELHAKDKDFFFERKNNAADIARTTVDLCARRIPGFLDVDPMRDIQVLAPMKKGEAGVINLNRMLQEALNPPDTQKHEKRVGALVLREGDKVMQMRNNYHIAWMRGAARGEGVFNGDMGVIAYIDHQEQAITVELDDGRSVAYDFAEADQLDIAYAASVHKSQGSEFPVVVLPLAGGAPMLMTRNLLYTAVTRATRMVMVVGREETVCAMVGNNRIVRRYGALRERLARLMGEENGYGMA